METWASSLATNGKTQFEGPLQLGAAFFCYSMKPGAIAIHISCDDVHKNGKTLRRGLFRQGLPGRVTTSRITCLRTSPRCKNVARCGVWNRASPQAPLPTVRLHRDRPRRRNAGDRRRSRARSRSSQRRHARLYPRYAIPRRRMPFFVDRIHQNGRKHGPCDSQYGFSPSTRGILVIEPWVTPESWIVGKAGSSTAETDDFIVTRMMIAEPVERGRVVFEHMIGDSGGIHRYPKPTKWAGSLTMSTFWPSKEQVSSPSSSSPVLPVAACISAKNRDWAAYCVVHARAAPHTGCT